MSASALVLALSMLGLSIGTVRSKKIFFNKMELANEVDFYCHEPDFYDEDHSSEYGPIDEWDVSKVTNFSELFSQQNNCNPPIGKWDVSSATDMQYMFQGATEFNQDIGGWDVRKVENMRGMFSGANSFDQDIGRWDVGSVTTMVSCIFV